MCVTGVGPRLLPAGQFSQRERGEQQGAGVTVLIKRSSQWSRILMIHPPAHQLVLVGAIL
jgi:hypothetical protein